MRNKSFLREMFHAEGLHFLMNVLIETKNIYKSLRQKNTLSSTKYCQKEKSTAIRTGGPIGTQLSDVTSFGEQI